MEDEDSSLAQFDDTMDLVALLGSVPIHPNEEPRNALSFETNADVSQLLTTSNHDYSSVSYDGQQGSQHDPNGLKQNYEDHDFAVALASSLQDKLMQSRVVDQTYQPSPSTSSNHPRPGRRVALESIHAHSGDMTGKYTFRLRFQDLKGSKRNIEFDDVGRKLYVSPFKPIKMTCIVTDDGTWNHQEVFLRIIPKFISNAEQFKPVVRCSQHCNPDDPTNIGLTEEQSKHFVRLTPNLTSDLNQPLVEYESDYVPGDNRLSVRMALPSPPSSGSGNELAVSFGVKFMCYHACRVSGLQRQRICLYFMLETADGECIGRQVIEVRSCASPGRDFKSDMSKRKEGTSNPGGSRKKALKRPHYVLVNTAQSSDSEAGCSAPTSSTSGTSNSVEPRRGFIVAPGIAERMFRELFGFKDHGST